MIAKRHPHPPMAPGPELRLAGRPLRSGRLRRVEALLAADRPDRLEASWTPIPGPFLRGAATEDPAGALRPGIAVELEVCGELLFRGRLERGSVELEPGGGRVLRVVAWAGYHRLRGASSLPPLHQVTDSEVAEAVARSLELVPVVDSTSRIHRRLSVEGDPLRLLRARARACGFQLAITRDRLYFLAAPPDSEPAWLIRPGPELERASIVRRGVVPGRRGGSLHGRGDPRWRPLSSLVLEGVDPQVDGTYRIVRAAHRLDAGGYRASVEVLEDGLDLGAWDGAAGPPSLRGNSHEQ